MATAQTLSVSDLLREVNLQLYRFNDIAVEGEVSNFVRSAAGHLLFEIASMSL